MKTEFKTFLGIFDITPREELYTEIEDLETRVDFLESSLEKSRANHTELFNKHSTNLTLLHNTEAKLNEALAENTRLTEEINRLTQRLSDLPTRGAKGRFIPKRPRNIQKQDNETKEVKETDK